MITPDDLKNAHFQYLIAAQEGNDRAGSELVRASSLGRCAIATAMKRERVAATHPRCIPENDYNTLQLFRFGIHAEHDWCAALSGLGHVIMDQDYANDVLVGEPDAIITEDGSYVTDGYIVEIKQSESRVIQPPWAYQCAAYMLLTGIPQGFLIVQHRPGVSMFGFTESGNGTQYSFYSVASQDPILILTRRDLDAEIENHRVARATDRPEGIRCGRCCDEKAEDLYPKTAGRAGNGFKKGDTKPGTLTVRCPWFGECWGLDQYRYSTGLDDDGNLVLTPIEEQ